MSAERTRRVLYTAGGPCRAADKLNPGDHLILSHEGEPTIYRVVEVNPVPEIDQTDQERKWSSPPHYVVLERRGKRRHIKVNLFGWLHTIDPVHHPVCATCGLLWPCEHVVTESEIAAFADRLKRLCAHCSDEVTNGQFRVTFPAETEGGEPVIYHGRQKNGCGAAAVAYAQAHDLDHHVIGR